MTANVFASAIAQPLSLSGTGYACEFEQPLLSVVQRLLEVFGLLLLMRVTVITRVGLLARIAPTQFDRHLRRNGAELMRPFIAPRGTLARRGHVTADAVRMLRSTRYRGVSSHRVSADVAVATHAQIIGIHGRCKLRLRLVNAVARAAADPCLCVLAPFPFRVLLPVLLHMTARPPRGFVGLGHDRKVLRA